jgi:hypothetical protein
MTTARTNKFALGDRVVINENYHDPEVSLPWAGTYGKIIRECHSSSYYIKIQITGHVQGKEIFSKILDSQRGNLSRAGVWLVTESEISHVD